ncbi:Taste receptor type 2 member 1 [Manis javanica]|nr:Taste receptor type 2 member 1 [Manis javanica]
MLESYHIVLLLFAVIQFLIGVLANGIIVVVNSTDLIKQRTMMPLDLLLCCLAISRICFQLDIFYINLAVLSLTEFPPLAENFTILMFLNESGLWFATWLSVFYCAKIATVAHPTIFWLKTRISKLVPWLILGSLLYVSITSVFHSKHTWILQKNMWLGLFSKNATTPIKEMHASQFASHIVNLSLPLIIFLISVLLLIFSLGRHTQKMRNTAVGTRNLSMSVHVSTLVSILSFLVLYLSHYLIIVVIILQNFKLRRLIFLFCILVVGSYPSGHSIILILGNPKLKQNAKKFLLLRKCCQ